ncbi:conserved hypothetical protein [Magnetospirillum sp. LM-5]|uniref:antitoxin MazE family protein n=1 Tax=Magnetospirillum sp. LM-5 TaxID=2681466 RepID=UPI0013851ACB|nr:antitoxin MazE family protein [Magnetospirillum sp. LM-5]CAA7615162.1 conserved hypothetical protein [Magnetospirillum sp. LM-5]
MVASVKPPAANKFRRYRETQQARGLKLLRLWIPDPRADGFRAEAHRQASILKGSPEEADALAFIEAVADLGDDGESAAQ